MFCTYLTIYKGTKLPRRYIGSSTVENVKSGYNGSIKSKKFREAFKCEQKTNKALFKTRILSFHSTQLEAVEEELRIHLRYDVVRSENYMNQSYAQPNGFFGRDISGELHPMWGKSHSIDGKRKISESLKAKFNNGELVSPFKMLNVKGENNPFYGKVHTESSKNKMRKPKKVVPKWMCKECKKLYDGGNYSQHMKRKHHWTTEQIILSKGTK